MEALVGALMTDGTPAPYGKACTNCVRSKCRCIYRVGGPDCERCHRLLKTCVPSETVRKRNSRRPHVSRAAHLEEKIEDLVSLFRNQSTNVNAENVQNIPASQASQSPISLPTTAAPAAAAILVSMPMAPPGPPMGHPLQGIIPLRDSPLPSFDFNAPPIDPALTPPAEHYSNIELREKDCIYVPARTKCNPPKHRAAARGNLLARVFEPRVAPEPVPETDPQTTPACEYQPTDLEAEERLQIFREDMLVLFPFIYLPPSLTAKRLRDLDPFFWFNIMTVTCKRIDEQLVMSDAVWKFVAERMIMEHEKSLDLLWGLLTLMAWAQYHRKDRPYFSVLASLVKSLVYDYCLNKPPRAAVTAVCLREKAENLPPKEKSMDERRAVLACFFITSQISHTMKRIDALVWTPFMDECLELLSRQPEWEGDVLLAAQVKIQLLTEQLTRAIWQSPDSVAPAYFSTALRSQLRDLKSQLPAHVVQNPIIISNFLSLELSIVESMDMKPGGQSSYAPNLQRFESLEASLQITKKWFDNHAMMPTSMYTGVIFTYWCYMGKCIGSLVQLAFEVDDPAWDRRAVKERVDIFNIMDQVIQAFDDVSQIKRQQNAGSVEEDMFTKCARLIRTMKRTWITDTIKMDGSLPSSMAVQPQVTLAGQADDPLSMPLYQMDKSNSDRWMAEFFEMNWEL
ncbi:hypothetical protein B0T16DRAFT_417319 [Cercophora newfieldiana]|uniref:Zn(2)-C6 fungal-type domain-containing protein n=1 Tax=Cercophora newfieldiana TaxID=92897 RepID=A0AA39Y3H5_9PEZI|nr:hypothetical protein B0T16DRAFT_417319 [Cercophora newfieldiana]